MKNTKTITLVIFLSLFVLSFSGCSKSGDGASGGGGNPAIVVCEGQTVAVGGVCVDKCSTSKPSGYCEDGSVCYNGSCVSTSPQKEYLTKAVDSYIDDYRYGTEYKYNSQNKIEKIINVYSSVKNSQIQIEREDSFSVTYDANGRIQSTTGNRSKDGSATFEEMFGVDILIDEFGFGREEIADSHISHGIFFTYVPIIEGAKKKELIKKILKNPVEVVPILKNIIFTPSDNFSTDPLEIAGIWGCYRAEFSYDDKGRLSESKCYDQYNGELRETNVLTYDDNNRVIKRVLSDSKVLELSYSGDNLVTVINRYSDGRYSQMTFTYDEAGRLIKAEEDIDGQVSKLLDISYDSSGRIVLLNAPTVDQLSATFSYTDESVSGRVVTTSEEPWDISYSYNLKTDEITASGKIPASEVSFAGIDLEGILDFSAKLTLSTKDYTGFIKAWLDGNNPSLVLGSAKFSLSFNDLGRVTSLVVQAFLGDFDNSGGSVKMADFAVERQFDSKGRPVSGKSGVFSDAELSGWTNILGYKYDDAQGEVVVSTKEFEATINDTDCVDGKPCRYGNLTFKDAAHLNGGGTLTEDDFICSAKNPNGLCKEANQFCNRGVCGYIRGDRPFPYRPVPVPSPGSMFEPAVPRDIDITPALINSNLF